MLGPRPATAHAERGGDAQEGLEHVERVQGVEDGAEEAHLHGALGLVLGGAVDVLEGAGEDDAFAGEDEGWETVGPVAVRGVSGGVEVAA